MFILDFYKIFCMSLLRISGLEDRKVKLIFILLGVRPITTHNDYISSYEVQNGLLSFSNNILIKVVKVKTVKFYNSHHNLLNKS